VFPALFSCLWIDAAINSFFPQTRRNTWVWFVFSALMQGAANRTAFSCIESCCDVLSLGVSSTNCRPTAPKLFVVCAVIWLSCCSSKTCAMMRCYCCTCTVKFINVAFWEVYAWSKYENAHTCVTGPSPNVPIPYKDCSTWGGMVWAFMQAPAPHIVRLATLEHTLHWLSQSRKVQVQHYSETSVSPTRRVLITTTQRAPVLQSKIWAPNPNARADGWSHMISSHGNRSRGRTTG